MLILRWKASDVHECLAEYAGAVPLAAMEKRKGDLSDRDVWAKLVSTVTGESFGFPFLRKAYCTVLSLLLNETDCERSFSSDQRQSEGRRHRLLDRAVSMG